jgi:type II restriction/modification system DNA methylase subunit YeeA
VARIHADLTAGEGLDLSRARPLAENIGTTVRGSEKGGSFEVPGELARSWLRQPNPNGQPNSNVLHPWVNGMDITRRPSDKWLIDFGVDMPESDAALHESPFAYVLKNVKLFRVKNHEQRTSCNWWLHRRSGEELRAVLARACSH